MRTCRCCYRHRRLSGRQCAAELCFLLPRSSMPFPVTFDLKINIEADNAKRHAGDNNNGANDHDGLPTENKRHDYSYRDHK